jgi:4'-phosphopantetheinyl transferase
MTSQTDRLLPVHLWLTPVNTPHAEFVATLRRSLAHWEQRRLDSLMLAIDQTRYTAAHVLVRVALTSLYPSTTWTAWGLCRTEAGKPFVRGRQATAPGIHLSLSHARGLVGCAIAGAPVGLDLEALDEHLDVDRLAPHAMAEQELAAWALSPRDERVRRFLCHWTLKEAMAKALGVGMMVPLASLAVELHDDGDPGFIGQPSVLGDDREWRMRLFEEGGTHIGAVAVRSVCREPVDLHIRRVDMQALASTALQLVTGLTG